MAFAFACKYGLELLICKECTSLMYPRLLKKELLNQLIEHPVVTVLGLRLAGKTTLVKHTLADYQYVNLKFQIFGNFPIDDPGALLRLYSGKVIFDEIQYC